MKAAPYGSWKSPITADKAAAMSVRFLEVDIQGNQIFWLERHPSEGGRVVLMSWKAAEGVKEVLPKEYSVRTRANEYGGGALLLAGDRIYFINDKDQQLYCFEGGKVRQVTHEKNARFADGCIDPKDGSLYYVREVHGDKVVNTIVKIEPKSGEIKTVAAGHDFYSNPRISPDGRQLAYVRWDQPNMSWDGSELYLLDLKTVKERLIAGGKTESIADPQWG
ncbi:MAG TPA: S9 family peptidase, partial [Rhabdochlamydiaceae bacterium]